MGGWEIRNFDRVALEMPLIPANGGLAAQATGHVVWAGNTALGITRVETGLNALGLDKIPQQVSVASKGTPSTEPEGAPRLSDQGDEAEAEPIGEVRRATNGGRDLESVAPEVRWRCVRKEKVIHLANADKRSTG